MENDLPNIRDILIHYGATIRSNHGQTNLRCPFHGDSHQSATANLDKQLFVCFACGVQGNSLQIIAGQEGVTIREAIGIAEGITGVSHSEVRGEYLSGRRLPKKQGNHYGRGSLGTIRRSYGT